MFGIFPTNQFSQLDASIEGFYMHKLNREQRTEQLWNDEKKLLRLEFFSEILIKINFSFNQRKRINILVFTNENYTRKSSHAPLTRFPIQKISSLHQFYFRYWTKNNFENHKHENLVYLWAISMWCWICKSCMKSNSTLDEVHHMQIFCWS